MTIDVLKIILIFLSSKGDKTLAQSDLRKSDITVLAIVRNEETIPNPSAATKILAGDELISFGQLENIRKRCVPKKERIAK